LKPPDWPWWLTIVTLQERPFVAEPAGTRPSIVGSGCELGEHGTPGVAASGGSARVRIGTAAGVCPPA